MHFNLSRFTVVAAVFFSAYVSAFPLESRQGDNKVNILVLQFADVLEQLESTFYKQALTKFAAADFAAAGFPNVNVPAEQFQVIQQDEATHSVALRSVLTSLGALPVDTCNFTFDAVLTDVATMAAAARVVETVGVSAYLGAAHLITDPSILTAAGSILTVEARHQTILNTLSGPNGTSIPNAFDVGLNPPEVLALASPFITGCDLGIPANPTLTITTKWTLCPGTKLTFSSAALNGTNQDTAFCQMLTGGAPNAQFVLPLNQCIIPPGVNGPVYIYITSDNQPLLNDVVNRATGQIIAGPTIAFVDTQPQLLNKLARLDPANPTPVQAGASPSSSSSSSSSGSSVVSSSSPPDPSATPSSPTPSSPVLLVPA